MNIFKIVKYNETSYKIMVEKTSPETTKNGKPNPKAGETRFMDLCYPGDLDVVALSLLRRAAWGDFEGKFGDRESLLAEGYRLRDEIKEVIENAKNEILDQLKMMQFEVEGQ